MESAALFFAADQQPHGDRLHPSGGKARRDLLPKQRRHGIADQPIQNAACFLRAYQLVIDAAVIEQRRFDGFARDFVKNHPPYRDFRLEHLHQMPADTFAFAVFVGGDNQFFGIFERGPQIAHDFLLFGRDHIQRGKVFFDIDAQPCPGSAPDRFRNFFGVGRQIAHMTHAGFNLIAFREKFLNSFRFGGRFNNDQSRHKSSFILRAVQVATGSALGGGSPA